MFFLFHLWIQEKAPVKSVRHECIKFTGSEYAILAKGKLVCSTENIEVALITFISMFYLLDLDYPASNQIGMYILQ